MKSLPFLCIFATELDADFILVFMRQNFNHDKIYIYCTKGEKERIWPKLHVTKTATTTRQLNKRHHHHYHAYQPWERKRLLSICLSGKISNFHISSRFTHTNNLRFIKSTTPYKLSSSHLSHFICKREKKYMMNKYNGCCWSLLYNKIYGIHTC